MKSYLSQSWEWKLITTSALKRLQPFRNIMASLEVSAFPGSATLIILNQCMKTEVRKGVQKPEVSILSCLRDVNFFVHEIFWSHWLQVVLPASKYSDIGGSRGSPGPSLAAAGNWWWREALRADPGRNSLYCNVAGLRKQVWSDLALGSLQVMAVCPVAAEEWTSWVCSISSCRFLVSSSRSAGRTGGLSLFAFICSSQSSQVPCKESIKWLHVMFSFLSLHPDVNVDSLALLSLFLSIIEKNHLWTKPRLGNGSSLVGSRPKGKGCSPFCCVSSSAWERGFHQSVWRNYAIFYGFFKLIVPILFSVSSQSPVVAQLNRCKQHSNKRMGWWEALMLTS